MQIEHAQWGGDIIGQSGRSESPLLDTFHYSDSPDQAALTRNVVHRFVDGKQSLRFFRDIQTYFGRENDAEFWNQVLFSTSCRMLSVPKPKSMGKGRRRSLNAAAAASCAPSRRKAGEGLRVHEQSVARVSRNDDGRTVWWRLQTAHPGPDRTELGHIYGRRSPRFGAATVRLHS